MASNGAARRLARTLERTLATRRTIGIHSLIALAVGWLACGVSLAMIVPLPLDQMVAESRLVILGDVESIDHTCGPCSEPNMRKLSVASVRVVDTMKGIAEKVVRVYFTPGMEPSPSFLAGERCILFLERWRDGWRTVQGYGGKMEVVNGVISRVYSSDVPKNQSVEAMTALLRRLADR